MERTFKNFSFEKSSDYLLIKKNESNFLMITDISSSVSLRLILSLVKKMIAIDGSHNSLTFSKMMKLYSNNEYTFSKRERKTLHVDFKENLRSVC